MTEDQRITLMRLIRQYGTASEELGAVPSSLYWNAAYDKQNAAEDALRKFINEEIGVRE